MAAVKAYFYRLRDDLPDVCEGHDIPIVLENLRHEFGRVALRDLDPKLKIPGGPLYYSDAPRNCHESTRVYHLEDAISDCLRSNDPKGKAKEALCKKIAAKIVKDPEFREDVLAYQRVPQSWSAMLMPLDPSKKLDKKQIAKALADLQDRDFSHAARARGRRHPLARITESKHFSDNEKISFVADYMMGRKKKAEAPSAVRIGNRHDYQEFNRAHWLEQNRAFIVETVGDIVRLREHFTATNKLKKGAVPDLPRLEPGALDFKP